MREKMTPHIIAVMAFVIFVVLGLACASTPPAPIEERKAEWLKPERNRIKLERSMAAKNVPIAEQCFLYCDAQVKDKIFASYKGGVVVLPVDTQRIWAKIGEAEMEITFTGQSRSVLSALGGQSNLQAPALESGQSYWLFDPPWVVSGYRQVSFMVLPLTEEGIEFYTRKMWDKENNKYLWPYWPSSSTKDEWESYEEYHDFITKLWEVRKEETLKQLN